MTSDSKLALMLGLANRLSVMGDRATTALGARFSVSLTQAVKHKVKLPPAESPAT